MCEVMFKLIAFIAVVFSAEGFWLPDKPTPAAPTNEIKTPVIIGKVHFCCLERFCFLKASSGVIHKIKITANYSPMGFSPGRQSSEFELFQGYPLKALKNSHKIVVKAVIKGQNNCLILLVWLYRTSQRNDMIKVVTPFTKKLQDLSVPLWRHFLISESGNSKQKFLLICEIAVSNFILMSTLRNRWVSQHYSEALVSCHQKVSGE